MAHIGLCLADTPPVNGTRCTSFSWPRSLPKPALQQVDPVRHWQSQCNILPASYSLHGDGIKLVVSPNASSVTLTIMNLLPHLGGATTMCIPSAHTHPHYTIANIRLADFLPMARRFPHGSDHADVVLEAGLISPAPAMLHCNRSICYCTYM